MIAESMTFLSDSPVSPYHIVSSAGNTFSAKPFPYCHQDLASVNISGCSTVARLGALQQIKTFSLDSLSHSRASFTMEWPLSPHYSTRSRRAHHGRSGAMNDGERKSEAHGDHVLQRLHRRQSLMQSGSWTPTDLTPDFGFNFANLFVANNMLRRDNRKLTIMLGVGFLGYQAHSQLESKAIRSLWFQKLEHFDALILGALQPKLQALGIWKKCKVHGYEVTSWKGHYGAADQAVGKSNVIIRSEELLLEWAEQMHPKTKPRQYNTPSFIVRVVTTDSARFDQSFRTPEEDLAEKRIDDKQLGAKPRTSSPVRTKARHLTGRARRQARQNARNISRLYLEGQAATIMEPSPADGSHRRASDGFAMPTLREEPNSNDRKCLGIFPVAARRSFSSPWLQSDSSIEDASAMSSMQEQPRIKLEESP